MEELAYRIPNVPMTLIVLFDAAGEWVMYPFHKKQQGYNFIGGKFEPGEDPEQCARRELMEETKFGEHELAAFKLIRHEKVESVIMGNFDLYVYAAKLKQRRTELPQDWLYMYGWTRDDLNHLQDFTTGFGWDTWVYLNEARAALGFITENEKPLWLTHMEETNNARSET